MKRYNVSQKYGFHDMESDAGGEWIRYEDHCEAMKRIAGEAERCKCCGYLVTESEHRGCLRAAAPSANGQQAEPVANNEAYDLAYDKIDRFLRSNLDDDDYAEFSRALDSLFAAPAPVASPAALTREDRKRIARDVQVQCSLIPGASFYNAAEMAIDAFNEASPAKPVYDCSTTDCQCDACMIERGEAGPFNDVEDRAPSASPEALTDAQTRAQLESLARHSYGGRFPVYMSGEDARALLAASTADQGEDARDD